MIIFVITFSFMLAACADSAAEAPALSQEETAAAAEIEEAEELLVSAKTKRRSLLADKITGDNIYKALIFFDKLYDKMNEAEKREFLSQLVDNVQIYEERKENGQWLKSIEFKLPIIEKEFTLSLDNDAQNETVCLMEKKM